MIRITGFGATYAPVTPPSGAAAWVRKLRVPAYWAGGYTGKGIKVGVIDTGIDTQHGALAPNIVATASFVPGQPVQDSHGHGTHVAGIIRQVAPDASLVVAKGLSDQGEGEDAWLAAAIRWCKAQNVKVINASWGCNSEPTSGVLRAAVQEAVAAGILFVAAAGNEGHELLNIDTVGWPARWPEPFAVAATWQMLYQHAYSTPAMYSSAGPEVDASAPGTDIISCAPGGGWVAASGTSMATPVVAGLAALKACRWQAMTGHLPSESELVTLLLWGTRDIARAGRDVLSGVGEVDAVPLASIRQVRITVGSPRLEWSDQATLTGGSIELPDGVAARIEAGRFVAPFRGLAVGLGARDITYDENKRRGEAIIDVVPGI